MRDCKAFITGLAGLSLNAAEKDFIAAHRPWGFVLFARNIKEAAQVRALTDDLRALTGRGNLPVFADQEGGRVQRLRPPLAPAYPPAARIGALYGHNAEKGLRAAWVAARLIAADLQKYGLNADFMPVLDIPACGSHNVIGDRAYGEAAPTVIALGRQAACGLRAGGILAVMKHIPGHGRAFADTHKETARAEADKAALRQTDFAPFKALAAEIAAAMTAHMIYPAYDAENPATLSAKVINEVIRGEIGFDGLLISDDLSMQALAGNLAERTKGSFAAGCDMALHCNGEMGEMQAVAENAPYLAGAALARAQKAADWAWAHEAEDIDEDGLREEFAALMNLADMV